MQPSTFKIKLWHKNYLFILKLYIKNSDKVIINLLTNYFYWLNFENIFVMKLYNNKKIVGVKWLRIEQKSWKRFIKIPVAARRKKEVCWFAFYVITKLYWIRWCQKNDSFSAFGARISTQNYKIYCDSFSKQ